jgi:RNA ligase
MNLDQLLDTTLLNQHIHAGLINVQRHPTLPLRILNYSHLAQYEPHWGDGTIDYCRGLIVDDEENIVARPFKKFHNLGTAMIPETWEENLPEGQPLITKKYDGSLGIYYEYDGQFGIATRGSFTSPQANWATKWIHLHTRGQGLQAVYHDLSIMTPLFEIVYNENRIVVKYDFEGLVLLSLVHKETGLEICRQGADQIARYNDIRLTEDFSSYPLSILKNLNDPNEEGFVVSYPGAVRENNEQHSGSLKVKIKMADYVRLHRIVTGMNARSLWEIFKSGGSLDFLKDTPLHVQEWVDLWGVRLSDQYHDIENSIKKLFMERPIYDDNFDKRVNRGIQASWFFDQGQPELKSLFFALLDGKDINGMIWDMIEPQGDDRSFQPAQGEIE